MNFCSVDLHCIRSMNGLSSPQPEFEHQTCTTNSLALSGLSFGHLDRAVFIAFDDKRNLHVGRLPHTKQYLRTVRGKIQLNGNAK